MVGFARAFSDGVSGAYLADVFVLQAWRGLGVAHRLVEEMVERGPGREFRWMLHTADAHALYADFGFAPPNAATGSAARLARARSPASRGPPDRASDHLGMRRRWRSRRGSCSDFCWCAAGSTSSCSRSTPTSSATSAATRFTRRPSTSWTSSGSGTTSRRAAYPVAHPRRRRGVDAAAPDRLRPAARPEPRDRADAAVGPAQPAGLRGPTVSRLPPGHGSRGDRRGPRRRSRDGRGRAVRRGRAARRRHLHGRRRRPELDGARPAPAHGRETGVPIDVLWLRLPRPTVPLPDTLAYIGPRRWSSPSRARTTSSAAS